MAQGMLEGVSRRVAEVLRQEAAGLPALLQDFPGTYRDDPVVRAVYLRHLEAFLQRGLAVAMRARVGTQVDKHVVESQQDMVLRYFGTFETKTNLHPGSLGSCRRNAGPRSSLRCPPPTPSRQASSRRRPPTGTSPSGRPSGSPGGWWPGRVAPRPSSGTCSPSTGGRGPPATPPPSPRSSLAITLPNLTMSRWPSWP